MNTVIGWVDSYNRTYPTTLFNSDRKKALIERIRKREYNFTHFDHSYLQYGAPYYDDGKFCVLTKAQWDDVIREAYKDAPLGQHLMPQDVITIAPVKEILFEKTKFIPKDVDDNV